MFILNLNIDTDGNGCIICAMARTLLQSQSSSSAIRPQIVYSKLKIICKHLVPGRQEDAHEFLRYLVEAMERAYLHRIKNWKDLEQYSKETTPLNQILGGYLRSAVRCLSCQHVSVTFQHFEDLLLDIRKANSIEEAVDMYFARERLEDTGYKCEACKKRVSATKQFSLERAPIALCVQLKRFSMMGGKLNKPISIRSRLELTQFSSNKKTDVKLEYKLVSLVTHIGASQHCGHYTAIGCTESGTYYQFDDSMVRPISVQSVLDTQAYLLFYELIDNTCLNGNGSRQNFKDIDMFSDSPKSSMIKKSYTGSMVSNGTSTTKTLNYEKKPGFIGPQMPQKNGISSTNTSQNPIKSNQQPTNSKLVNNILSGSKIGSAQNGNTSNLSNNNNGPVSPAIKKTELNGNISAHSPAKRLVNPFTANNTQNSTKKQSLPSMPRLSSSSPSNEASTSTKNVTSPVPSTSSNGKQNGFCASNTTISNNKPKSLVPDYSDESDSEIGTDRGHDIVKTKTGPWKVIENDCSDRPSLQGSTDNTIRPVSAPSTPTSTHSNSNDSTLETPSSNQQKVYRSVSENGTDAVGHLLKQSHRGYGNSNVQTWNGDKSIIDKEIMQERRDERKRQYQEDRETDMDRGRIKKIKTYRDDDRQKTSRNYFQFAQNRENSHVNRAKWLSNNQTRAFQNNKGSSMSSFSQRASHFTPRSFNNNNNHHSHHYRNSYSGHGKNHQKRWNQQQYSGGGGNRYHNGNNSNHNRERRS